MPLVGQIGETDVAGQLAANDVLHIVGGLGDSLGIAGADCLGVTGAHGVGALNKSSFLADWRGSVAGRDGGTVRNWRS